MRSEARAMMLTGLIVLGGCGPSVEEQKRDETVKALDLILPSLNKLDAATQVGVTYAQYGPMLIDAKAVISSNLQKVRVDGLRENITNALKDYEDANDVWRQQTTMQLTQVTPGAVISGKVVDKRQITLLQANSNSIGRDFEFGIDSISASNARLGYWGHATIVVKVLNEIVPKVKSEKRTFD